MNDKIVEARLLRVENAVLRKRIAELEAALDERSWHSEPTSGPVEPTPGFFNAENMDYLLKVQTHHRQYMIGLENRIADLERAQREREGEL